MKRMASARYVNMDELPEPNIVPLRHTSIDDELPISARFREAEYEIRSEMSWEWNPAIAWECVEGVLLSKAAMRLGGTAYILAVDIRRGGKEISSLVLMSGGLFLDFCMRGVEVADRVHIQFLGLLETKPGQPAKDWKVQKV